MGLLRFALGMLHNVKAALVESTPDGLSKFNHQKSQVSRRLLEREEIKLFSWCNLLWTLYLNVY